VRIQKEKIQMHIRISSCLFRSFLLILVGSTLLFSQSQPPVSDPRVLSLVSLSITALTGGTGISDVTLSGTAAWSNGTKSETASATLMAKGSGESRFDMTLSAGHRSEIRNDGSSSALGEVLLSDGSVLQWSPQNCMVNAAWFFPQLSVLAETANSSLIFSYVGQESRNGQAVQHIQSYQYASTNTAAVQQWSTMDIYMDAASLLPTAFVFNTFSTDGSQTIPVEVDFSNYQTVGGVQVPFRIQRYVAGNLGFDFSVASARFNTGLQDSLFAIQ
jgi:hypothetical protein